MNKRQKIVQGQFLDNEEAVIGMLEESYKQSLQDITKKAEKLHGEIEALTAELDFIEDEDEREIQKSKIRSKVYQKKYQDSLSGQVGDILDKMQKEEFKTVADYLDMCYEDGFAGTLYDLQGQGIPLAFPLDQEAMVRAVQLDSKISQGLYTRLGEDVAVLKKKIASDVTRGIASGMSFKQVAQQLSGKTNIGFNNAVRIARTEGHRIQVQAGMDACYKAKEKGADVVKQWDSTLDAKTRDSHAQVDGEIKELDEKFSNGLMFPGDPSGGAAEVVNCRCALLQRARWAVQGGFTKMNNFTKQLETFESPEDYAEFKKGFFSKENRQYMNYVQEMENKYKTKDFRKILDKMDDREYKRHTMLAENNPIFNKKGKIVPAEAEKNKVKKVLQNTAKDDIILYQNKGVADSYDLSKYKHISSSEFAEWKKQCGVSTKEEYRQIYKHTKADGSNGGYVRSHRGWAFNAEMRSGKEDLFDDDDKKTLATIRKLCKANATDRDVILDRFVDSDYLSEYNGFFNKHREDLIDDAIGFVKNNMIGKDKVEKSIVSASYGENVLTDRDVHIRLHCPKGTHMFVTNNKRESEVLFHDGLTYEIAGVDKESYKGLFGDRHRLVLDVVVKNYGL